MLSELFHLQQTTFYKYVINLPKTFFRVNFKKNEKNYDATNSAVYRMLQEAENDPKSPEPGIVRLNFFIINVILELIQKFTEINFKVLSCVTFRINVT